MNASLAVHHRGRDPRYALSLILSGAKQSYPATFPRLDLHPGGGRSLDVGTASAGA